MSTVSIEEGNKIIAVFDGWEAGRFEHLPNKLHKMEAGKLIGISIDELKYHSSWDWLHPVLEKMNTMLCKGSLPFEDGGQYSFLLLPVYTDIKTVWKGLVDCLQWYNNNQTTQS